MDAVDRNEKEIKSSLRHYCCACSNYRGKIVDNKIVTLHRFPADKLLQAAWVRRIKLVSPTFRLNQKNDRLCSTHFRTGVYVRGQKDNIPSIFILSNGKRRIFGAHEAPSATDQHSTMPAEFESSQDERLEEDYQNPAFRQDNQCSSEQMSVQLHDYISIVQTSTLETRVNKDIQTDPPVVTSCVNTGTQTSVTTKVTIGTQTDGPNVCHDCGGAKSALTEPEEEKRQYKTVGIQTRMPDLCFEDIEKDDEKVLFYTGIPNGKTFRLLFDELGDAEYQTRRSESSSSETNKGRPRSLRLIDEFFLVLMRLRLGLLLDDLKQRFHISKSTCSNITNNWMRYLSVKLEFLLSWPNRATIDYTMPLKFKRKYPKCRVIIDCTELRTETPTSLVNKTLMYSHYKSHMTYKALLGITPTGIICFASDLWAGSISDKEITKRSGLLDLCETGDAIMADKGFLISDLTTPRGIRLIVPPLKLKRFSRREVEETRRIANLRIDVERAMERVKNFRILQGVMPITLAHQATWMWKICVYLSNLLPPLVHDEDD